MNQTAARILQIGLAILCLSCLFPPRVWTPLGYTVEGSNIAPRTFLYSSRIWEAPILPSTTKQSAAISLEKMIAELVLISAVTALSTITALWRQKNAEDSDPR